MNRRRPSQTLVAMALVLGAGLSKAGSIESAPVVLHSLGDPILFDFSANAAELAARPRLVGLEVLWKVTPGAGATEAQVNAGLAIPSFELGDRLHSALDATLPARGTGPATFESSFFNDGGLPIGPTVIDEFYQDGNNSVGASLFTSGEGAQHLTDFFNAGGMIEAQLQLTTDATVPLPELPPTQGPGGPSGGNVPEPMSLAIWGGAAALAISRRKRRPRSHSSL
jgi:hypothetical protein